MPADYEYSHPLLDHDGPWTLDDVMALPEETLQRVELVDGSLLMSPGGTVRHQRLASRITEALHAACPPGLEAIAGLNLEVSDTRMLIADFTVNVAGEDGLLLPVADLLLAGEVLSPSNKFNDLVLKRKLYAEAGVPFYLVVDPKDAVAAATLFELKAGEYVEIARSEDGVLKLERPFPVTIELSL
ncbi:Uma2 family endonuclease [Saccharothrix sp. ALI-22-I]|uniref:Uma2 family endonuclease n=1 Tax=Saccharothrix sp. ALI-22-I TaxID=1933778 RepID=UPI001EE6AA28|nr:Uma2 family endonuclease [Saccharothrix sp. ALI-22-I]